MGIPSDLKKLAEGQFLDILSNGVLLSAAAIKNVTKQSMVWLQTYLNTHLPGWGKMAVDLLKKAVLPAAAQAANIVLNAVKQKLCSFPDFAITAVNQISASPTLTIVGAAGIAVIGQCKNIPEFNVDIVLLLSS